MIRAIYRSAITLMVSGIAAVLIIIAAVMAVVLVLGMGAYLALWNPRSFNMANRLARGKRGR